MSRLTKHDRGGVIYYCGLIVPGRSLEQRAKLRGVLDALRDVRSPDPELLQRLASGEPRRDGFYFVQGQGDWHPPFCGEIADWALSTVSAIGARAREEIGPHNANVERLRVLVSHGQRSFSEAAEHHRQTMAIANSSARDEAPGTARNASRPAAQAYRAECQAREAEASSHRGRAELEGELAEAIAERAAVAERHREIARQVIATSDSIQHKYWSVRTNWSRRKHGARPVPAYCQVLPPAWMTSDAALFEVRPETPPGAERSAEAR